MQFRLEFPSKKFGTFLFVFPGPVNPLTLTFFCYVGRIVSGWGVGGKLTQKPDFCRLEMKANKKSAKRVHGRRRQVKSSYRQKDDGSETGRQIYEFFHQMQRHGTRKAPTSPTNLQS